jgi:hypothetical protein
VFKYKLTWLYNEVNQGHVIWLFYFDVINEMIITSMHAFLERLFTRSAFLESSCQWWVILTFLFCHIPGWWAVDYDHLIICAAIELAGLE